MNSKIAGIVLINPAVEPDDFVDFAAGAQAALDSGETFLPGVANDIADPESKELGYDRSPARGLIFLIEELKELKPKLPTIKNPTLLMYSQQDHVVPPGSADRVRSKLGGPVDYVELKKSYYVATIDYDGPEINRRAVEFGKRRSTEEI